MSKDLKKEVQEAPLLWPLTPIPTFEEVYDPENLHRGVPGNLHGL